MVYDNHLDKYKLPIGITPIQIAKQILEITILSSKILEEGETLYPAPTFPHISYREFNAVSKEPVTSIFNADFKINFIRIIGGFKAALRILKEYDNNLQNAEIEELHNKINEYESFFKNKTLFIFIAHHIMIQKAKI